MSAAKLLRQKRKRIKKKKGRDKTEKLRGNTELDNEQGKVSVYFIFLETTVLFNSEFKL